MDVGNVGGGMTVQQVTGGLDLEAFMMSVSAERASNLENQMAAQINEIKERQAEIKELNQLLTDIRSLKGDGDPGDWQEIPSELRIRMGNSGCTMDFSTEKSDDPGRVKYTREDGAKGKSGKELMMNTKYEATNNTIDKWINEIKGSLDNLNSTSQMDMIRLQSLSNKRNQAFEMLTNQVQKFSKVNDSVIGNMR